MKIEFEKTTACKQKPTGALGFGKYFTDYMFVCDYADGAWQDGIIKPYAPFTLDPSTSVFHYGQAVFEGMKAYKNDKGEVRLFRPRDNFERMQRSCERVCIPPVPVDDALKALKELINIERDWIPTGKGESLYIRPAVMATERALGVHSAHNYKFFMILSPSGAYYSHGFAPVGLYVEREYVRACKGGTGAYKVIGNYAASLFAAEKAIEKGYDQVLWLDAKENEYVEEVGSMNIFFVFGDCVITPALNGSILPGVTRDSILQILRDEGMNVKEEKISITDIKCAIEKGELTEIFGTGTAAVISPVDRINIDGTDYTVSHGVGPVSHRLFDELTGIQTGVLPDKHKWITVLQK